MAKGRKAETSSTSNGSQHEVIETVRGLAEVVTEHGLSELVVEIEGTTITLRRGGAMQVAMPMHMPAPMPMSQASPTPFAHHAPAAAAVEAHDGAHVVTSPFVGTFYRRPNPDSPNYVAVNDKVEKGAVLCIVEAMKLMNEIEADLAGTVVAVLAEDGAPVEYGQALFKDQAVKKVLVANRGEIALRIIRALREMNIKSVAVYSTADADALHVKFADQAVCIGPPPSRQSYLNIPSIISAAEVTRADAVHPGYGFLAENAEFAEVCGRCHLNWIGPPPDAMRLMGDKIRARAAMQKAGVPILPGSGTITSEHELEAHAERIGLPVILKAAAGGGGRGMKIIHDKKRLIGDWKNGANEALAAFGNPDMYMERYCERPRHIEIQVVADKHGHYEHLGERECSIQRRHQKVIEEAPSKALREDVRAELTAAAIRAISSIGYHNVGTLEFLLDQEGRFYFMEMNTRLQVEHPVTELVTGVDVVREQLRIASGETLSFKAPLKPRGHAIELRINAEDPESFAPWPGKITALHLPGGLGVRLDTHLYEGYRVPPNYDSLIAKMIVHDSTRELAMAKARRCLDEVVIEGPRTNIPFLRRILDHPEFIAGDFDTGFVGRMLAERAGAPATATS